MSEPIVNQLNYVIPTQQRYNTDDLLLIQSTQVSTEFNPEVDYIEVFVYDLNNEIVTSDYDFINYQTYQDSNNLIGSQFILNNIKVNPVADLDFYFLDTGTYIINYNFYRTFFSSSVNTPFYISEISPDRTELRLDTNYLTNDQLAFLSAEFTSSRFERQLDDFYLNLGDNSIVISNNFLLDNTTEDYSLLVKLYEPLPQQFNLKSQVWIVDKISDPSSFQVEFIFEPLTLDDKIYLKGPNTNLNLKDQINNSTFSQNYNSIISSSLTSSQQQYFSLLEEKGININIDFGDYSNFIHFSSAKTRLENFYYKVQQIENYTTELSTLNALTLNTPVSSSKVIIQNNINNIIENFDEYEYYLYYDSSSYSWPKSTSTKPYLLYPTSSINVVNWYNIQLSSASLYDENNQNYIYYSIPEYVRNNPDNNQYILFMDMIGQLFDNIWIYYKDVTNKYNADNRLDFGVSKDLIAEAIRDLGVNIYQNNFSSADVFSALLGINPEGGLFPLTGSELITTYVTSSNEMTPLEDIEKSIYKRIYHNLPYLLKTKGTTTGLQTLISIYGVDDTILRVAEFGGKDKNESNDWDYWKSKFNYKLDSKINPNISTEWTLNPDWGALDNVPSTLQFRFKLPTDAIDLTKHASYLWGSGIYGNAVYGLGGLNGGFSQSIWSLNDGSNVALVLEYTGSGLLSGSYSGSVVDPYYQYANLIFTADGMTSSASVYLPFLNGDWWSVMVSRTGSDYFTLYAANNIYNGDDGSSIGFVDSSSYTDIAGGGYWNNATGSHFSATGFNINIGGKNYGLFTGSYQEIRYYTVGLSSSVFYDYTMNPDSIKGNYLNSSPDQLAFRAPLGGELYKGTVSVHPKVTGSWIPTSSFVSDSNFTINSKSKFTSNTETVYLDQPAAGIKNIVSNKIQIVDMNLPEGNTLSQYRSIQQQPTSSTYTENLAYTEVAFSPQNEINDDIMASLGFFNMGNFIGDPRQRFTEAESYPDLDVLRNAYFEKYISNYDLNDYIRLIKYFDNSLFKMVQDFTPARTSLASGVVVKQHLLERNKYPQPEVEWAMYDYSGSIEMGTIEGGAGGSVNNLNGLDTNPYYVDNVYGVTQSWQETFIIPSGVVTQTHDSQDEFYNGEFSGSNFVVENGELNEANPFKQVSTTPTNYTLDLWGAEFGTSETTFLNTVIPSAGTASFWSYDAMSPLPVGATPPYVRWAKIHSTDLQGNNNSLSLQYLESLTTNYSKTRGPFTIISISPKNGGDYFVFEFAPGNSAYSFPGPPSGNVTISNIQMVFNPYITSESGPFQNSDYNAIINNATGERLSEWYQQVDYATSQTVPVNFQQIISGTAYPAAIQDSNYTSYQYSGIRYWGSKNTTDNFNSALTATASIVQTYQNDNIGITTLGAPSTENLTNVGLYYQWAGGTDPEVPGKTNFQIKFMFDAQGNVFLPDLSSSYYNDLLNAFPQNSQINVIPYNPLTGNSANVQVQNSIQGTQTVFWPGVYFNAYLTTQSGSTSSDDFVTTSLRFQNVAQNDFDNLTISNYIFTTASGDSSTLIASSDWGAIISTTLDGYVSSSTNFQYYQVPSTESNPNRAGFDFSNTLVVPSPWIFSPDVSVEPFISGSFNTFPDLVRVQDVSSGNDYQYYSIASGSAIYGSAVPSIKLVNNIASKYITSQGRVNKITFLRLVLSPEKLYVNVNKAAGESGPGFILPLYPTSELINNFPNIIKDLSEKNLI